jgi:hypothetical protein
MSRRLTTAVSVLIGGLVVIGAGLILELVRMSDVSIYLVIAGATLVIAGAAGAFWHHGGSA